MCRHNILHICHWSQSMTNVHGKWVWFKLSECIFVIDRFPKETWFSLRVGIFVIDRSQWQMCMNTEYMNVDFLILSHVHLKHCRLLILRSHKAGVKTEQSLKRAIRATLTKLSSHKQLNLNCEESFLLFPLSPLLFRLLLARHLARCSLMPLFFFSEMPQNYLNVTWTSDLNWSQPHLWSHFWTTVTVVLAQYPL